VPVPVPVVVAELLQVVVVTISQFEWSNKCESE